MFPSFTPKKSAPPYWLAIALCVCLSLVLISALSRQAPAGRAAEAAASSTPTAEPTPTPEPTPEPTPTPTPEPDWSLPVPQSPAVDQAEWFADAVFIGDSRVDGFHLFSGVTAECTFLDHTGLTVYEALEGKEVIRQGSEKLSILDALAQGTYGKVYIALGINELGYKNAQDYSEVYGQFIDAVAACQPDARIYIQSIIPVNTAKCKANDQPYYVTNETITAYNQALAQMAAEKKVRFLSPPDALLDENGESEQSLSADGVHFKKEGYALWRDYLLTHTGM